MIPIQPVLILLLICGVLLYFSRLRSRLWDRIIVVVFAAAALVFVMNPEAANRLAAVAGVGRGADLFFYVSIPGLAFALLLLLSRIRVLEQRETKLIRELALLRAGASSTEQHRPQLSGK